MSGHVDVYYSLQSPWTYLGWPRFLDIVAKTGATATFKPVQFPKIFAASGGLPLAKRPVQRRNYRMMELKRFRKRLGMPLIIEPKHFPVDESLAARTVVALRAEGGEVGRLSLAFMSAVWAEERDIADPEIIREICMKEGLNGDGLVAAAHRPETISAYDADTQEAIERGVFGAPTFIVGEEIFWGQDRLDFVSEALQA